MDIMRKKQYVILHIENDWITGFLMEVKNKKTVLLHSEKWSMDKQRNESFEELSPKIQNGLLSFFTLLSDKRAKIILTFAHVSILTREMEFPKSSKKEMNKMLQIYLQEVLPKEIQHYLIHYKEILPLNPSSSSLSKWLITALPYTLIKPYLIFIEQQGFKVEKLDYMGYGFQRALFEDGQIQLPNTPYIGLIEKQTYGLNIYLYYQRNLCFSRHYHYNVLNQEQWLGHIEYFLDFFNHRIAQTPLSLFVICNTKEEWNMFEKQWKIKKNESLHSYQRQDQLSSVAILQAYKSDLVWFFLQENSKNPSYETLLFSAKKPKIFLFFFFFLFLTGVSIIGNQLLTYFEESLVSTIIDFNVQEKEYEYFVALNNALSKQTQMMQYIQSKNTFQSFSFEPISWVLEQKGIRINTVIYGNHRWEIEGESLEYDEIILFISSLENQMEDSSVFLQNIWKKEQNTFEHVSYQFKLSVIQKRGI